MKLYIDFHTFAKQRVVWTLPIFRAKALLEQIAKDNKKDLPLPR